MLIRGNTAIGFEDAGIYIGGIVDTGSGSIVARMNRLYQNNRGIIVEDSFGASLQVESNVARHNHDDGIFLHNSDGIEVLGNLTTNNGVNGIELDPRFRSQPRGEELLAGQRELRPGERRRDGELLLQQPVRDQHGFDHLLRPNPVGFSFQPARTAPAARPGSSSHGGRRAGPEADRRSAGTRPRACGPPPPRRRSGV